MLSCLALLFAFIDEFVYSPALLSERVSDGLVRGISTLLQIASLLGGGRLPEVVQLLAPLSPALSPSLSETQMEQSLFPHGVDSNSQTISLAGLVLNATTSSIRTRPQHPLRLSVEQHNHVLQSHAYVIQSYAPILINAFHFASPAVKRLALQSLAIGVWAFRTHALTLPHCTKLHPDTFGRLLGGGSGGAAVWDESVSRVLRSFDDATRRTAPSIASGLLADVLGELPAPPTGAYAVVDVEKVAKRDFPSDDGVEGLSLPSPRQHTVLPLHPVLSWNDRVCVLDVPLTPFSKQMMRQVCVGVCERMEWRGEGGRRGGKEDIYGCVCV
jgi:hypothetical protein